RRRKPDRGDRNPQSRPDGTRPDRSASEGGGGERSRTADLVVANDALSQPSYAPGTRRRQTPLILLHGGPYAGTAAPERDHFPSWTGAPPPRNAFISPVRSMG